MRLSPHSVLVDSGPYRGISIADARRMKVNLKGVRVVTRTGKGLGMWPDSDCYDPQRPSWLPNWIDTPSESGCKFGFFPSVSNFKPTPPPPAAAPPGAPPPDRLTDPTWSPEDAIASGHEESRRRWMDFFTDLDAQNEADQTKKSSDFTMWLWIGGAVAAVLLLRPR